MKHSGWLLSAALVSLSALVGTPCLHAQSPVQDRLKPPGVSSFVQKFSEAYFPGYLKNAVSLLRDGQVGAALEELQSVKLKTKRPASPEKICLLEGIGHQLSGEHERALDFFKEALHLRGSNSDVYFFIALSERALNRPSSALTALQDGLWFNRMALVAVEEFYLMIGQIERGLGNTAKASQAFNTALQKNPNYYAARTELLSLNIEGGKRSSAIRAARSALELSPESIDLKISLLEALLLNADRLLDKDQIAEAKKLSASLVNTSGLSEGQELAIIPLRVKALLASRELEEAEKVLKTALEKYPGRAQLESIRSQIELEKQALTPKPGEDT